LLDFATMETFDDAGTVELDASRFQSNAALRLLYYFPRETTPLIANQLRLLDIRQNKTAGSYSKRQITNGVRAEEFIKAVTWCKTLEIQAALDDIADRTDDLNIKKALEGRGQQLQFQGVLIGVVCS